MKGLIVAVAVLALAGTGFGEDSGVLRGEDADAVKHVLKVDTDGTLLMKATVINESDPQVGEGNVLNFVPKWNGSALNAGGIFDNGNIGIGTTAPGQKLEVVGTVKATAFQGDGSQLTGIGTGLSGSGTSGAVSKWTGTSSLGDSVILESGGGNIGIGTASPSQKLEVVGTVKATAFQGDGSGLSNLPASGPSLGGTPSTQAFSDAPSEGVSGNAARADHRHGMPAIPDISAHAYNDADVSLPNNSSVPIPFPKERYDTDGIHDNVTDNTRLTAKTAGKYYIFGQLGIRGTPGGSSGYRNVVIVLNGTTVIARVQIPDVATTIFADTDMNLSTHFQLAANDYVQLHAQQGSGGTIAAAGGSGNMPLEFGMVRIGN